jgi:hypothetical protein
MERWTTDPGACTTLVNTAPSVESHPEAELLDFGPLSAAQSASPQLVVEKSPGTNETAKIPRAAVAPSCRAVHAANSVDAVRAAGRQRPARRGSPL